MSVATKFLALVVCIAASGCAANVPDHRMVGVFRSDSGESVMITPQQEVYASFDGAGAEDCRFVGSVQVDPKKPREAFLITNSASSWIGSTFLFAPDYKSVSRYPYEWTLGQNPEPKAHYVRVY